MYYTSLSPTRASHIQPPNIPTVTGWWILLLLLLLAAAGSTILRRADPRAR